MRKREIIKIGGSLHIRLLKADLQDLNLEEGDHVDIEDMTKIK